MRWLAGLVAAIAVGWSGTPAIAATTDIVTSTLAFTPGEGQATDPASSFWLDQRYWLSIRDAQNHVLPFDESQGFLEVPAGGSLFFMCCAYLRPGNILAFGYTPITIGGFDLRSTTPITLQNLGFSYSQTIGSTGGGFASITPASLGISAFERRFFYEFAAGPDAGFTIDNLILTTPLPEPTTWGLLLTGFGLMGCSIRRRYCAAVQCAV